MVILVYSVTTKELIMLFKLYGETLSEIIGHGVKALSYNIGKKVGFMLADKVTFPEIGDALEYIREVMRNSVKINYNERIGEITIEYTLVRDMYGFDNSKEAVWLTFYFDGIVAGMLEKITNKKTNIKSDYNENSNKVLITGEQLQKPLEQVL